MNTRIYINRKSQNLSKNIEESFLKIFDIALNIFNYDPDDYNFYKNSDYKNIPQFVVSREYVWEFAGNTATSNKFGFRKVFDKLYKNLVIYFAMDEELVLKPYSAINGSLNNYSRQEYPKTIKFKRRNPVYTNIIRFENVIIEINNKLYRKVKSTVKHLIHSIITTDNELLSSIKNKFINSFQTSIRKQDNEIFNKGFFKKKYFV